MKTAHDAPVLMIRISNRSLFSSLAACAAGLAACLASAATPERGVQPGLVPESAAAAQGDSDPGYPRLRLPRSVTTGIALDFLQPQEAGATFYGGTRSTPGLGLSTSESVGGMLYPLSGNWFSTIETSLDTRSAGPGRGYGFLGQVHRTLPGGFDMSVGLRYRVYESGASALHGGAIDPAALSERSWSLYPPAGGTSSSAGYELRLNYRYGERNTLGVTYGSGSESDYGRQLLGMHPGEGRQFGLTGEHWLTPDWALNYGVMAQEQIGPHRGQGLRLGLRYRF